MKSVGDISVEMICPQGRINDPDNCVESVFPYLMGVELEMEGVRVDGGPVVAVPMGWTTHVDASLRDGIEFVTNPPVAGAKLKRTINAFYAMNVTSNNSPRTSTHIHVNASNVTVDQLRTMFALSYILEPALFQIVGETRKYCGYCMPLTEMAPNRVKNLLISNKWAEVNAALGGRNEDKYYGFNVNSVRKHGTVEFRYFPGGPSKEELESWLHYCTAVKRLATSMSLADFIGLPDVDSLVAVLTQFFGDWAPKLIGAQGPIVMFDMLQELAGMFPDTERKVREDELVFISEPLLLAVKTLYFPKASPRSWEEFRKDCLHLKVMTNAAWWRAVNTARMNVVEEDAPPARPALNVWDEPARPARSPRVGMPVSYAQLVAAARDANRGLNLNNEENN